MKTFRIVATAAVAGAALSLAACDSGAENAMEDEAEAIDESYEAEADAMRDMADGTANEEVVDDQADALEAEGEEIKDTMEDNADTMDAAPQ